MKRLSLSLVFALSLLTLTSLAGPARADPLVWTGPTVTFSKASFADPSDPANQDRIFADLWITRGDRQGIYNAASEFDYPSGSNPPSDTEWAWDLAGFNTGLLIQASNHANLTFNPWETAHGSSPPDTVGIPGVLHVISRDIYIDVRFTLWQSGNPPGGATGGAFSYERASTQFELPLLPFGTLWLALAFGAAITLRQR